METKKIPDHYILFIIFWLISIILLMPIHDANASQDQVCKGIWASDGVSPFVGSNAPLREVVSPNRKFSIKAASDGLSVVGSQSITRLEDAIGNLPVTEILWSPNSKYFAVNESDGGLVGTWTSHLYKLDESDKPIKVPLEKSIRKIIDLLPHCQTEENANFGVVAWLRGGNEILVIAEVPPHSSCRNMGEITGLRISLQTRRVIERLSERVLRKNWSSVLGCRFVHPSQSNDTQR